MTNRNTETQLLHAILREFATRPGLRLWRNNTGATRIGPRVISYGLKGSADISGIRAGGQRIEIECKSQTGKPTPEQVAFGAMIAKFGGLYILARSVADVEAALK